MEAAWSITDLPPAAPGILLLQLLVDIGLLGSSSFTIFKFIDWWFLTTFHSQLRLKVSGLDWTEIIYFHWILFEYAGLGENEIMLHPHHIVISLSNKTKPIGLKIVMFGMYV